jgi:hypothetical protein
MVSNSFRDLEGKNNTSIRKLKEVIKRHKYDKRTKSCEQTAL